MTHLLPPHGGVPELVCRTVPANEIESFQADAGKLPKVPVSQADLSTVYRIADGTLSPLTGPMNHEVYNRVLDEAVVEHSGRIFAWTIPLAFPVTSAVAATLSPRTKVALTGPDNEVVGTLDITDVFEWDKPRYLRSVYGTDRTDHPGADMVLKGDADKTHLVGGELHALPQAKNPSFGDTILSPPRREHW